MGDLYKPRPPRLFRFGIKTLLIAVTLASLGASLMPRSKQELLLNIKVTQNSRVVGGCSLMVIAGKQATYKVGCETPLGQARNVDRVFLGSHFQVTVSEPQHERVHVAGTLEWSTGAPSGPGCLVRESTVLHVDKVVLLNGTVELPLANATGARDTKVTLTVKPGR